MHTNSHTHINNTITNNNNVNNINNNNIKLSGNNNIVNDYSHIIESANKLCRSSTRALTMQQ